MDVSGELHLDVDDHNIFKQRLDSMGNVIFEAERHDVGPAPKSLNDTSITSNSSEPKCGSCYGAEDENRKCCNTCSELAEAYRAKGWGLNQESVEQCAKEGYVKDIKEQQGEGCRMYGDMAINKVAGNIHFAPGRSYQQGIMHIHELAPFAGMPPFDLSHQITKLAFGQEYPVRVQVIYFP